MKAESVSPLDRPRVLAVLPGFIPSTILTVVKPLTALHHAGRIVADITLEAWVPRHKIARADIVIFSRNFETLYGHTLETTLALGKPIIYDIDDNLFELPSFYQNDSFQQNSERLVQFERYLKTATLVRVYSEPLRERVRQLNSHVVRVDGPIDWDLVPSSPPPGDSRCIRVIYATSRLIKDDLTSLFLADMQRLLSTYPGRVEFFCWGYHPPELRGHPAVYFLDFVPDYDRFFRKFARAGFDIGLAPLRDEVFYRSKSNNKFREYAACRIAGVYSDLPVYSDCVVHEQTGLLVSQQPSSWFHALARLVEDRALREKIQERAFGYAYEHYSLEKAQTLWLEQIVRVIVNAQRHSALGDRPYWGQNDDRSLVPLSAFKQSRLFSQLPLPLILRGLRLISGVKTRGLEATIQKLQWSLRDFCGLLRVKWNLSHISHVPLRRRSTGEDSSRCQKYL